jgi:hypothetical protein
MFSENALRSAFLALCAICKLAWSGCKSNSQDNKINPQTSARELGKHNDDNNIKNDNDNNDDNNGDDNDNDDDNDKNNDDNNNDDDDDNNGNDNFNQVLSSWLLRRSLHS